MEKNYFLTYANSSLKDNPSHLDSFVGEIISLEEPDEIHQDIDKYFDISDAILFLIEDKEMDFREVSPGYFGTKSFLSIAKKIPYLERKRLIKEVCKEILSEEDLLLNYFVGVYDIAYQTVTGCECDVSCCHYDTKKVRWGLLGRSGMLEGPKRLRCHECDQLYFVYILLEIIRGKEYWNIELFTYMLDLCNQTIIIRREIGLTEAEKDCSFVTRELIEFPLRFDRNIDKINTYYDLNPFRLALLCSAIKSLVDFLLNNDRRKLKYCDECENFFISKTIRISRFCSDKCRRAWHNRKRIESGEHREYKRKKRMEGAKESYYG